ncbi:MAG TPA: hypothetical protein PKD00_01520 [Burkholderiales bacterium]|nr:hypothetical protein [Burkholderiales bacterium]
MIQDSNIQSIISDERTQVNNIWKKNIILIVIIIFLLGILIKYTTPIDEYIIYMNIKKVEQKQDTLYIYIGNKVFKLNSEK